MYIFTVYAALQYLSVSEYSQQVEIGEVLTQYKMKVYNRLPLWKLNSLNSLSLQSEDEYWTEDLQETSLQLTTIKVLSRIVATTMSPGSYQKLNA